MQSSSGGDWRRIPGMLPWPKVDFSKFGEIEEVELAVSRKFLVRT
ncbi:hypothetical protein ACNKHT_00795 [Shigella flexneri]